MTTLLNATITSAGTFFGQPFMAADPKQRFWPQNNNIELLFGYGSGGTSIDVFLQTSHDGGANWKDTARFGQLTTSSARAIWRASAADSVLDLDQQFAAPFSSWWRVKFTVVGSYANTTLRVNVVDGINLVPASAVPF